MSLCSLDHFVAPPFCQWVPEIDMNLMQSLLGNGWDLHHFAALAAATFGSINFAQLPSDQEAPTLGTDLCNASDSDSVSVAASDSD